MSKIEAKIKELGLELPPSPKPVASYISAVRSGNTVYTSGQLPFVNGTMEHTGIVGKDVSVEQANALAKVCALNALSAINGVIGDLDKVVRIVKVVVFVASTPEFTSQPLIANGASEFLTQVFGEKGQHARSALGVACLPLNAPVEVELLVEVAD